MMQLDLFETPTAISNAAEKISVGDAVRLKSGVLADYEAREDWESYHYLLDAKGVGVVLSEHEHKGGKYYIVTFGKMELYITDDELEVVCE